VSAEQEAAPVVPAPREASLSRLLLWRVIGFSLLLSLGATLLMAHIHRDHEETQQRALIDAVVSLHRVALSRAVWALETRRFRPSWPSWRIFLSCWRPRCRVADSVGLTRAAAGVRSATCRR